MKPFILYFLIIIELFSCLSESNYKQAFNPEAITKDFNTWWAYNSDKITFAREYETFDADFKSISKDKFFQSLMTGDYIVVKLLSNDTLAQHYKLQPLSSSAAENIRQTSVDFAEREYQKYKMEGMQIPDFNFSDLNGTVYNKQTTKGKIIVLNVWFIQCVPCVAEMPALNEIEEKFKNRPDILFLALTFDSADSVKSFLKRNPFNYEIIPGQEDYIIQKLGIRSYPYQVIVNKEGKILRVFNNYEDIEYWINKES